MENRKCVLFWIYELLNVSNIDFPAVRIAKGRCFMCISFIVLVDGCIGGSVIKLASADKYALATINPDKVQGNKMQ